MTTTSASASGAVASLSSESYETTAHEKSAASAAAEDQPYEAHVRPAWPVKDFSSVAIDFTHPSPRQESTTTSSSTTEQQKQQKKEKVRLSSTTMLDELLSSSSTTGGLGQKEKGEAAALSLSSSSPASQFTVEGRIIAWSNRQRKGAILVEYGGGGDDDSKKPKKKALFTIAGVESFNVALPTSLAGGLEGRLATFTPEKKKQAVGKKGLNGEELKDEEYSLIAREIQLIPGTTATEKTNGQTDEQKQKTEQQSTHQHQKRMRKLLYGIIVRWSGGQGVIEGTSSTYYDKRYNKNQSPQKIGGEGAGEGANERKTRQYVIVSSDSFDSTKHFVGKDGVDVLAGQRHQQEQTQHSSSSSSSSTSYYTRRGSNTQGTSSNAATIHQYQHGHSAAAGKGEEGGAVADAASIYSSSSSSSSVRPLRGALVSFYATVVDPQRHSLDPDALDDLDKAAAAADADNAVHHGSDSMGDDDDAYYGVDDPLGPLAAEGIVIQSESYLGVSSSSSASESAKTSTNNSNTADTAMQAEQQLPSSTDTASTTTSATTTAATTTTPRIIRYGRIATFAPREGQGVIVEDGESGGGGGGKRFVIKNAATNVTFTTMTAAEAAQAGKDDEKTEANKTKEEGEEKSAAQQHAFYTEYLTKGARVQFATVGPTSLWATRVTPILPTAATAMTETKSAAAADTDTTSSSAQAQQQQQQQEAGGGPTLRAGMTEGEFLAQMKQFQLQMRQQQQEQQQQKQQEQNQQRPAQTEQHTKYFEAEEQAAAAAASSSTTTSSSSSTTPTDTAAVVGEESEESTNTLLNSPGAAMAMDMINNGGSSSSINSVDGSGGAGLAHPVTDTQHWCNRFANVGIQVPASVRQNVNPDTASLPTGGSVDAAAAFMDDMRRDQQLRQLEEGEEQGGSGQQHQSGPASLQQQQKAKKKNGGEQQQPKENLEYMSLENLLFGHSDPTLEAEHLKDEAEAQQQEAFMNKHQPDIQQKIQEQEDYLENSPIANRLFGSSNLRMKDLVKLPGQSESATFDLSLAAHSPKIMKQKVQKAAATMSPEQKQKALEYAKEAAPYWSKRLRDLQKQNKGKAGEGQMHFFQ